MISVGISCRKSEQLGAHFNGTLSFCDGLEVNRKGACWHTQTEHLRILRHPANADAQATSTNVGQC